MGLDMYLRAEKYIGGWRHGERAQFETLVDALKIEGLVDEGSPSITARFNVGYWRKANAIHRWFVEHVQNGKDECEEHPVSREELKALRADCKTVLDSIETISGKVREGTTYYPDGRTVEHAREGQVVAQVSIAERLLPSQSGFFFGKTDYDEDYLQDLKDTIEIVDRALLMPEDWDLSYRSSW